MNTFVKRWMLRPPNADKPDPPPADGGDGMLGMLFFRTDMSKQGFDGVNTEQPLVKIHGGVGETILLWLFLCVSDT